MAEGLSFGLPDAAAAAGLNEPITMDDQQQKRDRLVYEGVPQREAARVAGIQNAPPPAAASLLGQVPTVFQDIGARSIRGAGQLVSDATGLDFPEQFGDAAYDMLGPSDEANASVEQRSIDRRQRLEDDEIGYPTYLAGTIVDSLPATAASAVAPVVGGKLGAAAAGNIYDRMSKEAVDEAVKSRMFGKAVGSVAKAIGKKKFIALGAGLGAVAIGVPYLKDTGDERLRDQGIDPDTNPEAARLSTWQAIARSAGNVLPVWKFMGVGAKVLPKTNGFLGNLMTGAVRQAPVEAVQEVTDNLIEELFLNPELRKVIGEEGWGAFLPYVRDNLGEDLLVSAIAGGVVGGGMGGVEAVSEQRVANARIKGDVKAAATVLEPLGLGATELETLSKTPAGAEALKGAVTDLGRIERARKTNLDAVDTQRAQGVVTDEEAEIWKADINTNLDDRVDEIAKGIGAPKSLKDVRNERSAWEKERKRTASERLTKVGITAGADVTADAAEAAATRVEKADGNVEQMQTRLQATANPERRAETQRDLDEALAEQQQARIDGRVQVEGLTPAKALSVTQQDLRQTETDKRRTAQSASRERAVERQTEVEMPETMEPAARAQRAREILAEDAADARPDAGIDGRVKRLERQRRAATTPEDVDKLTNEIADLEARRGLPTPAVEAARRVLQAQGIAIPSGGEASRPAAQTAGLEGLQPTDAAPGPVGAAAPAGPRSNELVAALKKDNSTPNANDTSVPARAKRLYKSFTDRGMGVDQAATLAAAVATPKATTTSTKALLGNLFTPKPAAQPSLQVVNGLLDRMEVNGSFVRENGTMFDIRPYEDLLDHFQGFKGNQDAIHDMLSAVSEAYGSEVSAVITPDGEVVSAGTNFSPTSVVVMYPRDAFERGLIDLHTHPDPSSYSAQDIISSMYTGLVSRLVLTDGQVLEIRPRRREELGMEGHQLLFKVMRMTAEASPNTKGQPSIYNIQTRAEAMTQAAEMMGLIDYTRQFTGLDQQQKDIINDILEKLGPELTEFRAAFEAGPRPDVGTRFAETGSGRRSPSLKRAFDTQAGEGQTDADAVDSDEIDDLLGDDAGFRHAARKDRKPSVDKEQLRKLSTDLQTELMALATKDNHRKSALLSAVLNNELTVEQIEAGVRTWVENDGYKRMHALSYVTRTMFPDVVIGPNDIEDVIRTKKGRSGFGQKYWRIKAGKTKELRIAFELMEKVRLAGHGHIDKRTIEIDSKNGLPFRTGFVVVDEKLKDFLKFTTPEHTRFDKPHPADDVSNIKRDNRGNLFSDDALMPAKRTAKYLQANHYTLDKDKIAALRVKDMISEKGLAAEGLSFADVDRFIALQRVPEPLWTEDDVDFLKNNRKRINEKLNVADGKLKQLRRAYQVFVEENGADAEVGFMYQVDNRGRIYADGQFNPQGGGAIKALFRHKGVSLADMVEVDASASGWQISALMARDHIAAPEINLGRGQANVVGGKKSDLYNNTIARTLAKLEADAAVDVDTLPQKDRAKAQRQKDVAKKFLHIGNRPNGKLNKKAIKGSVIAVNYGGTRRNFVQNFVKVFKVEKGDLAFSKEDVAWGYLGKIAYDSLVETAPHAMALQTWAIAGITDLAKAMDAKYPGGKMPPVVISAGLDGAVAVNKRKRQETETLIKNRTAAKYERGQGGYTRDDNGDRVVIGNSGEDQVTLVTKIDMLQADADKIGRASWANLVQSFDAAVLHRSVERYKQMTNGAYITTNHDSFTVPPEHEAAVSAAVRESMLEIMSQVDVPARIYKEVMAQAAQHGVEVNMQPFDNMGQYNMDDLMTSTPVFGDGPKGEDYIPDYAEIPADAPVLKRAVDPGVPEAGVGAAASETPPARAPVSREQGGPLQDTPIEELTPSLRRSVDVANYMEQMERPSTLLTNMQNAAMHPIRAVEALERELSNAYQPIRALEKKVRGDGKLGQGMESAFKAAEIAQNDSGRNESLLYYGAGQFGKNMEFELAPGTVGLRDIFKEASGGKRDGQQLQHWLEYMAARRAQDLAKKGIKTPLTPADIQKALARANPNFIAAEKMWRDFNRANLKMVLDSGRITKAQHDAMAADDVYVPFYRVDQRLDGAAPDFELPQFVRTAGGALIARDPGIKAMKGGDKTRIANLAENMIKNSQAMAAASMRNVAANKTFDLLEAAGMARIVPGSEAKPNPNAIKRWVKGKEEWVVPLDDDATMVVAALGNLQPVQLDGILRTFNAMSGSFRAAISSTVSFTLSNLFRGMVANGILTSGANLTPSSNTITGAVKALGYKSDSYKEFKRLSGMGDYRLGQAGTSFGANDFLIDIGLEKKTAMSAAREVWKAWEGVGMASEMADRIAVYDSMVKRGVPKDEAAYQALSTMNYNRKGGNQTVRRYISTMPFLNAKLQGYARLLEGTVGRDATPATRAYAMKKLLLTGLVYSAANAAAWAWNYGDDERRKDYQNLPAWRRTMFINIGIGNNTFITLPQPFELGFIFGAMPTAIMDSSAKDVSGAMIKAGFPLEPGTKDLDGAWKEVGSKIVKDVFAMSLIPQAISPIMEGSANYNSFFDAPIEARGEQDLRPELRTTGADEFSKFLFGKLGGSRLTGMSPAYATYYGQNYGSVPYAFMAGLFNTFAAETGLAPPAAANIFGEGATARFAQRSLRNFMFDGTMTRNKWSENFYAAGNEATERMRSFKTTEDIGFLEGELGSADAYTMYNRMSAHLADIKKAEVAIRKSETMTPKEKRDAFQRLTADRNAKLEGATLAMRRALGAE